LLAATLSFLITSLTHWLLTIISRRVYSIFAGILIQNFLLQLDETVLWIRDVNPGSRIRICSILDPGSFICKLVIHNLCLQEELRLPGPRLFKVLC
jgi:hypothetical protein